MNSAGILIEVLGAAWILVGAWRAWQKLREFPEEPTYGDFAERIKRLTEIVRGQFLDQLKGFAALAVGLLLQLAA